MSIRWTCADSHKMMLSATEFELKRLLELRALESMKGMQQQMDAENERYILELNKCLAAMESEKAVSKRKDSLARQLKHAPAQARQLKHRMAASAKHLY